MVSEFLMGWKKKLKIFTFQKILIEFHGIRYREVESNPNIIEEYIENVLARIDVKSIKEAKLKVIVDCGNGAACFTTPYFLGSLDVKLQL